LLRLIRSKRKAWRIAKQYNTGENVEKYKKLEKEVARKIRNAKRKLEKDLAFSEDRNGKKFMNHVRSKTKSKSTIGPLKDERGNVVTDNKETADILNRFFASVP
jgi:hypothetical protein